MIQSQCDNFFKVTQPISPVNDNTKKAIVSTVLNGNDSAVESSVVQTVSSYIIRNETPCNVCEPTKNGQIKDCPTNHSSFKYDRRDKGGPISSHTRLRYSKRQQVSDNFASMLFSTITHVYLNYPRSTITKQNAYYLSNCKDILFGNVSVIYSNCIFVG